MNTTDSINYLTGSSYLSAERCKADGTTPRGLGGSAEKQEDTESALVTCDRQPQWGDDRRASYKEFAAFTWREEAIKKSARRVKGKGWQK